jgi:hypothetical protein
MISLKQLDTTALNGVKMQYAHSDDQERDPHEKGL